MADPGDVDHVSRDIRPALDRTVDYQGAAGLSTFAFDVFYVAAGPRLAKLRVALCGCLPAPPAHLGLLPGETQALAAVSQRIAGNPTGPTTTIDGSGATPGVSTQIDSCQLLTPAEVSKVIGPSKPPARTSVPDGADQCSWLGNNTSVGVQAGDSLYQFQYRLRSTNQALAGIGDQAAVSSEYQGKVLARKGNTWIQVAVQGTSNDRANATKLASSILVRL